jgi:hypothetical protein
LREITVTIVFETDERLPSDASTAVCAGDTARELAALATGSEGAQRLLRVAFINARPWLGGELRTAWARVGERLDRWDDGAAMGDAAERLEVLIGHLRSFLNLPRQPRLRGRLFDFGGRFVIACAGLGAVRTLLRARVAELAASGEAAQPASAATTQAPAAA